MQPSANARCHAPVVPQILAEIAIEQRGDNGNVARR